MPYIRCVAGPLPSCCRRSPAAGPGGPLEYGVALENGSLKEIFELYKQIGFRQVYQRAIARRIAGRGFTGNIWLLG